jgi:DNA-binding NtrC family response regulator
MRRRGPKHVELTCINMTQAEMPTRYLAGSKADRRSPARKPEMMHSKPKHAGVQNRINIFNRQGHVRTWDEIEREILRVALAEHGGSVLRTAVSLGIGRNTLYRRLAYPEASQP